MPMGAFSSGNPLERIVAFCTSDVPKTGGIGDFGVELAEKWDEQVS